MTAVACLRVGVQFVATITAIVLVLWTRRLVWVAVGAWSALVLGDVATILLLQRGRSVAWVKPSFRFVRELMGEGVPFLTNAILIQIIINFDVVVIGFVRSPRDVGIYSAAFRLAFVALSLAGLVTTTVFPQLVKRWESDRIAFRALLHRLIRLSSRLSMPVTALVVVDASSIIRLVYGNSFLASAPVLRVVFLLPVLGYFNSLVGQALLAAGRQHLHLAVSGLAAAVTVIVLVALVPEYGLAGASASVVAAEVVTLACFCFAAPRALGTQVFWGFAAWVPEVFVCAGLLLLLHAKVADSLWVDCLVTLVVLAAVEAANAVWGRRPLSPVPADSSTSG